MSSNQLFTVIGITDSRTLRLSDECLEIIASHTVFSGGARHHSIVAELLPSGSRWIEIKVPLKQVYEQYRDESDIVVFASGDPLFYGFGATLQREFPEAEIKIIPQFNSLQMLAHAACLPYHDMVSVSVTGRSWDRLDAEVIAGSPKIGVLTDRVKTPAAIARRLLEYGYDNYSMIAGENLGNELTQRVLRCGLPQAAATSWAEPNCIILIRERLREKHFGIPENLFMHLDGRERMITKMPVRLLSLSMLGLHNRSVMWDIGFCTGSVSIEAKLQFPDLKVIAFERREECQGIMEANTRRFGAPGIEYYIGDFMEMDLSAQPSPDVVFIGGHGGRLGEMLSKIKQHIAKDGVIVFNSVSSDSLDAFVDGIAKVGMRVVDAHMMTLDDFNSITIVKAQ